MNSYIRPAIELITLLDSDVITTSWQLPEIPSNGASATDATEAVGVATNY